MELISNETDNSISIRGSVVLEGEEITLVFNEYPRTRAVHIIFCSVVNAGLFTALFSSMK